MKYQPSLYAAALYELAEAKKLNQAVLKNFLIHLQVNKQSSQLPLILRHLKNLERKNKGLNHINLTSARPLNKKILQKIKDKFGSKSVITEQVDPTLIGGLIINLNDANQIDGSVKTQLNKIFK